MALPPGFELEQPQQNGGMRLPPGFQLEGAAPPSGIPGPRRTWTGTAGEAMRNIPSSAQRFATGLYEAATSPVETAKSILDIGAGALQKALPQKVVDFINQFDANPAATQRAVQAANAAGAFYKDRYGSVEQLKNTIATDPVGAAADLSTLLSGGATALGGVAPKTAGVIGKAARVVDPLTLPMKGAGAVMRRGAAAAGNVIDAVSGQRADIRAGQILREAATDQGRRPANLAVLRNELQRASPGSSGSQAAAGVQAPQLQALGQIVGEQRAPGISGVVSEAEEAGRRATIAAVTPDEAAARLTRERAAKPFYAQAAQATIPIDATMKNLLDRMPDGVMSKARELAKIEDRPFIISPPAPSPIVTATGAQAIPPKPSQITGDTLHYIKRAMDDILSARGEKAMTADMRRTVAQLRDEYLKAVESRIPAYGQARQEFARLSPPVNQAQVLTEMQNVLAKPTGVGERVEPFLNVLGRGKEAMLKRAVGTPRYTELSDVLTPGQIDAVQSVAGDLRRGANIADQAMRGRQALDTIIQANTFGFRLPALFSAKITLANDTLALLQGKLNAKVFDALEKGFQSGKDLDALIGKVPAKNRIEVLRALGEASTRLSSAKPTAITQIQASQQNALAPEPINALTAP